MAGTGIRVSREAFERDFRGLLDRTRNPAGMLNVAGRELANLLKSRFRTKDRDEPNRLSPRREHFWLQVSQSVNAPQVHGQSVSVFISDPRISQKIFGGRIEAKAAGALTIPVEERAYGRRASTFERETGLKLILIRTGGKKGNFENAVLAVAEGGGLTVEYVLTKSVTQQPDPSVLPSEREIEEAVMGRAQKFLDREEQAGGSK